MEGKLPTLIMNVSPPACSFLRLYSHTFDVHRHLLNANRCALLAKMTPSPSSSPRPTVPENQCNPPERSPPSPTVCRPRQPVCPGRPRPALILPLVESDPAPCKSTKSRTAWMVSPWHNHPSSLVTRSGTVLASNRLGSIYDMPCHLKTTKTTPND